MKKRTLLLLPLTALIAAPLHSQSEDSEGIFTVTPSFVPVFMNRGARQSDFSFQPTIEYSKGPLSLELFCNFPISDKIPGAADPQLDFAAHYTWIIAPNLLTVKSGVTLSTLPRANKDDGIHKATWEPSVCFGYTWNDIDFLLNFYYDITMKGSTYEFGIDYSIPLQHLGFDVELSALVGRCGWSEAEVNANLKVANNGNYWQAGVAIPYEFSKKSKLVVGWHYVEGFNNHFYVGGERIPNYDAVGRGVFNVSFSTRF